MINKVKDVLEVKFLVRKIKEVNFLDFIDLVDLVILIEPDTKHVDPNDLFDLDKGR